MKILIIRLSSIGDIVLTSPVLRCIKKAQPNTQIHYLTKPAFVSLLKNNSYIDKIHEYHTNITTELIQENFDYIIDLQNNFRTLKITKKLHVPTSRLQKLNFKKWLLVHMKINRLPHIHIVDRYLACTDKLPFILTNDGKGLDFFLTEEDFVPIDYLLSEPFIAIAMGSQHETKQIPIEKLIDICRQISHKIVLLGGKNDDNKAEMLRKNLPAQQIDNLCGKLTINQSAACISKARILLTGDTGLMHIAAALHTPIVSVWGNTVPIFGMYPYMPDKLYDIIENNNLKCRPCSKLGFKHCPQKHFKCMNDIDNNLIIKAINERFDQHRSL